VKLCALLVLLYVPDAYAWGLQTHVFLAHYALAADVLEEAGEHAVHFVARAFRCEEAFARRALGVLIRGDRVLRASPAPAICRTALSFVVPLLERHFGLYLARTARVLGAVETALAGGFEDWSGLDPEGGQGDGGADCRPGEHIARIVQAEHHARSRGEHSERDHDDRKIRIVRASHERERHRVKRVA